MLCTFSTHPMFIWVNWKYWAVFADKYPAWKNTPIDYPSSLLVATRLISGLKTFAQRWIIDFHVGIRSMLKVLHQSLITFDALGKSEAWQPQANKIIFIVLWKCFFLLFYGWASNFMHPLGTLPITIHSQI